MTAYRFVTLTCDECGEIYDDGTSHYVRDARSAAQREGWQRRTAPEGHGRKPQDVCPRHFGKTWMDGGIGWVDDPTKSTV